MRDTRNTRPKKQAGLFEVETAGARENLQSRRVEKHKLYLTMESFFFSLTTADSPLDHLHPGM